MFDMYACWTKGVPNTTVKVPCPWYLPWYDQVRNGFVKRDCGPDGRWLTVNSSHTWRDHSQCDADSRHQLAQESQMLILAYFRVIYTIGYSLSLASLSLALVILLIFRKLRCTRNYIHTNLFASFILRALSILTRDALLMKDAPEFRDNKDVSIVLSDQVMSSCRVAQVLMQYCVGANYYWLLVEGTPVLFVVPWIVVRYLHENTRLAKSTLTLIPLLGIHEVVFALLTAEQTEGVLHNLNLFFELFFNSFQVQSEIKKKWQRWKLGISILDEQRNTGSNTQQGGAVPLCHHDPPCSQECPLDIGSQLSSDPTPSGSQLSTQHHYHPGAKKDKAYCYVSAKKQVQNGLELPAMPQCEGEGSVKYSESYC
ncbi:Gastric inhibitory polypeptide receptor [Triplophysa tibetana]|uniref:Gastric inhibitory polypeptide receptor n=1 Tax=Triplophysa tibetana TaxID=1572043 RepID=A0A5A9MYL2_9TELE|nr:Gastric inhibitory polypeptide receptor [Triplophysa tibetana]